ncbi:hypothetical protein CAEBREN_25153 [Caenorhabditis brenneri]|uniref:Uncharacterized protein n=1 Tax=Caenorhabditis brenneri TaxID=135651 RepID=G0PG93_CAEBE|nr:hypothetical protein CAEBREN_25153 [Caenorhabditis brenneri]
MLELELEELKSKKVAQEIAQMPKIKQHIFLGHLSTLMEAVLIDKAEKEVITGKIGMRRDSRSLLTEVDSETFHMVITLLVWSVKMALQGSPQKRRSGIVVHSVYDDHQLVFAIKSAVDQLYDETTKIP